MNKAKLSVSRKDFQRVVEADPDPDPSYLEQDAFEDRLAQFKRGDFGFCYVKATVEVIVPMCKGHGYIQRFESPGLYGIEDDSGDAYITEVFGEECSELEAILKAFGVQVTE